MSKEELDAIEKLRLAGLDTLQAVEHLGTAVDKLRDRVNNVPGEFAEAIAKNTASVEKNNALMAELLKKFDEHKADTETKIEALKARKA